MTNAALLVWCFLAANGQEPDGGVAPPAASTESSGPATDADLRARLDQALLLLQKHEAELEALRKAPPAPPAPPATPTPPPAPAKAAEKEAHWYEKLRFRGYTQLRYNAPGAVFNDALINEQGDRSLGGNGGFLIRRARLILFGDVHPRVSVYLQPDFASVIGEQLGVAILRDWYADIAFDEKKEFRVRIGQSKVPFGFENMQSSQNRLPLDRNDALNSAVKDERDLGVFFYWAPADIRARFKHLVDSGLKGSGDYGVLALGAYNGQTANRPELNKFPHVVARATYPFALGDQFLELGVGGYYGQYTVALGTLPDGTRAASARPGNTFTDARGAVTAVLYPKPFGLMFEYTVGVGPQLGADNVVHTSLLYGGYATLSYKVDEVLGTVSLIPFLRAAMYDGGKKFVTNAPAYKVRELEFGVEWQLFKAFEVVLAYNVSERTSDKTYRQEYGHWTRLQAQFNY
jgi:hypothetical protein